MTKPTRTTDEQLAIGCLKFLAAVLAIGMAMGLVMGLILWAALR